ncbi:glycoside hydrolase family 13 protein [Mangrovimonas spongiae]|uniref:Alpha-amlyase n=1 Tax=Mangrovimonas spongiae TaxID=2494697 RepID=A0A428K6E4_9FLAO|nr:glycoside hydrolase family 13 protein [Mangrovimonas spongiae]RSK41909.1 alpha-amlyase [Mangrovimonas spongiae]
MKYHIGIVLVLITLLGCKESKEQQPMEVDKTIPVSNTSLERVEPPHWWVGFKNTKLQLLVKDDGIGGSSAQVAYPGVMVTKVHQADSPNYLFLDLEIDSTTKPGKFDVLFEDENGTKKTHTYELKSRIISAEDYVGFDSSDAIYLITPDRFANGDPSNDINENLRETTINRNDDYGRHGGDIKGITQHLDYIEKLGFTAIWPTPMLINDMPQSSYHGYAMTDFYQVDPRFGSLEDYKTLSQKMQEKDMKLIMDMVANHCGSNHWWMDDLPFKDWVNQQDALEAGQRLKNSNHRRTVNQDTYASKKDQAEMNEGWFVRAMPDLNQRNPFMANYIIQNNIWWIETLQLGGIRQDTYPYPDKDFMSDWAGAIMTEYPNFNIVGEEWSTNPLLVAYWQEGQKNKDGYESNLKSTMDFPMQKTIVQALNEEESWGTGLVRMYDGLANDFGYTRPEDILVFPDNHDMSRIYTQLEENLTKTEMALAYMACMPRTLQVYYGTEVLLSDAKKPGDHGLIRTDFPGGWENDTVNGFTGEGLSDEQTKMQEFVMKLMNYRKHSEAIHKGETVHFAPENGVYVLFRTMGDETVVCILNKNEELVELDLKRFSEMNLRGKTFHNIISGKSVQWNGTLKLNNKGVTLLTTK